LRWGISSWCRYRYWCFNSISSCAVGESGHVTAVDFAEKMVEICKANFSQHSNLDVVVQQVENLQFADATFDTVVCFGLFPHLENKEFVLTQLNRVLKLGDKLVNVHALSSNEIKSHHQHAAGVIAPDELPNASEMKHLLKTTGFVNIKISDEPGCYLCFSNKV
jgi:ubiquinone/menaquinone biosynthesis C-methylase UbiE